MRPELEIVKGPLAGHRFKITEKGLRLGRSSTNDIHVPDWSLSRSHCLFEAIGDSGIRVTDLASANGTLLNGKLLGGDPAELQPGDVVEAGATRVRVVSDGPNGAVPRPVVDPVPVQRDRRSLFVLLGALAAIGFAVAVAAWWLPVRTQPSTGAAGRSSSPEAEDSPSVQRGEPPFRHEPSEVKTAVTARISKPIEKVTTGTLVIRSDPDGAMVTVNGVARGLTPLTVGHVPAGLAKVRLEKIGFEEGVSELTVTAGERRPLSVALKRLPPPPEVGRLEVRTDPVGAQVLVDGRLLGETRPATPDAAHSDAFPVEKLTEGEHVLVIRMEGYAEALRRIRVEKGRTAMANVRLKTAFLPNVEIVTARGSYVGMLKAETAEAVDVEVSPGITRTFPRKEIKQLRSPRKSE